MFQLNSNLWVFLNYLKFTLKLEYKLADNTAKEFVDTTRHPISLAFINPLFTTFAII